MKPTLAEMLTTAERLLHSRELNRVEELCRAVLRQADQAHPPLSQQQLAQAHRFLGLSAYMRGRPEEALNRVKQSLLLAPDEAVAHDNMSLFLAGLERPIEAEAAARKALALQPTLAGAVHNLGMALMAQGRTAEAAAELARAAAMEPKNADVWNALGVAWQQLGLLPEAGAAFERALELRPQFPQAEQNQRHLRSSREALKQEGAGIEENNRGVQLLKQRSFAEAEAVFRRALQIDPNLPPEASFNLARALDNLGKPVAAEALYLSVLRQKPAMIDCRRFLGDLYFGQQRFEEAQETFRLLAQAEAANPVPDRQLRHAENFNNLATDVLSIQGRHQEARAVFQHALALEPDYAVIHSNALLNEQYALEATPTALAAAHAEYERRHAAPLRSSWRPFTRSPDPDRPLRLGFVSGDFFLHPVAMFLAPVLERLDREQWQTVCYSAHRKQDFMTARLVRGAGLWRQAADRSDEALAEWIRADGIDLLFDLSGHTGRNRLLTFARRPAPVQLTWAGYVGTTGLSAIDYLIADRFHVPVGAEQHYCEKILRLPDGYICYEAPPNAPVCGPLPAQTNGYVTFVSFNNSAKITTKVVAVWAQKILRRVPDAKLVLKCPYYDDREVRNREIERFAAEGIPADRLRILGRTAHLEQLAQYNNVDLALDTFPYSGGLTTCEASWMGVPVVTCPGETFAGRHSLSHLSNAGVTETITDSFAEYVELAVSLASDLPRLAELRGRLRPTMAGSALCNLDRFSRNFSAALRQVWRSYCLEAAN